MGKDHRITVGDHEVVLTYPGAAHTHGELWVYLPKQNIVVTGDLLFHAYYPFFDLREGDASILDLIEAVRDLADRCLEAIFPPGRGPLACAENLRRHADYQNASRL